eukprot:scpid15375/ scgid5450/ 
MSALALVAVLTLLNAAVHPSTSQGISDDIANDAYLLSDIVLLLQQINVTASYGNCVEFAPAFYNVTPAVDLPPGPPPPGPPTDEGGITSSDSTNDVMALYKFIFTHHVQLGNAGSDDGIPSCDDITSSEMFCGVVYDNRNICTPAVSDVTQPGLCQELYYIQGLLAPLLLSDDVMLAPWMMSLAELYCMPRNYSKCTQRSVASGVFNLQHSCPLPYTHTTLMGRVSFDILDGLYAAYQYVTPNYSNLSMVASDWSSNTSSDMASGEFPSSDIPFSQFMCAQHCEWLVVPTTRSRGASWFSVVVYPIQTMLPLLVIISSARSGWHRMWEYPNRLMIYLSLGVFLTGQVLAVHFIQPIIRRNMECHGDDTFKTSEELHRSGLAVISFLLSQFTDCAFRPILFFTSFAWWQLVLKLHTSGAPKWYVIKVNGPLEIVYFLLVAVWTAVITGLFFQKTFTVGFVIKVVFAMVSSQWIVLGPGITAVALSFLCLVDGYRRMYAIRTRSQKLRRKSLLTPMHTAYSNVHTNIQPRSRLSSRASLASASSTMTSASSTMTSASAMMTSSSPLGNDPADAYCENGVTACAASTLAKHSSRKAPLTSVSSVASGSRSKADKTMSLLLRRFVLYLSGILLTTTAEILIRFAPGLNAATYSILSKHAAYSRCSIITCGDLTECQRVAPVYSNIQLSVDLVFDSAALINAILICSWVFSPSAWRRREARHKQKRLQRRLASMAQHLDDTRNPSIASGGGGGGQRGSHVAAALAVCVSRPQLPTCSPDLHSTGTQIKFLSRADSTELILERETHLTLSNLGSGTPQQDAYLHPSSARPFDAESGSSSTTATALEFTVSPRDDVAECLKSPVVSMVTNPSNSPSLDSDDASQCTRDQHWATSHRSGRLSSMSNTSCHDVIYESSLEDVEDVEDVDTRQVV